MAKLIVPNAALPAIVEFCRLQREEGTSPDPEAILQCVVAELLIGDTIGPDDAGAKKEMDFVVATAMSWSSAWAAALPEVAENAAAVERKKAAAARRAN